MEECKLGGFSVQSRDQYLMGDRRIAYSTRVKIDGGVTGLGPRVNAEMRFFEDDDDADAVRLKAMADGLDDRGARGFRGVLHQSSNESNVIENGCRASMIFSQ